MAVVWPESPQTCIHTTELMDTHHLTQCLSCVVLRGREMMEEGISVGFP